MEASRIMDIFINKADECIIEIGNEISSIENGTYKVEALEKMEKSLYTLKTISFTMGYRKISELSSMIQKIILKIRGNKEHIDDEDLNELRTSFAKLKESILSINDGDKESNSLKKIEKLVSGEYNKNIHISDKSNVEPEIYKAKESKTDICETRKLKLISLDENIKNYISTKIGQGLEAYKLHVKLKKSINMKGARIFLIYTVAKGFGEIVASSPSIEDIEKGKDGDEIEMLILSNTSGEDIFKNINRISQLYDVSIEKFSR